MRDEVAAVAVALFARDGFAKVTGADIAAAAGISTRSFFRYFDTKEDVVLSRFDEAGERIRRTLERRPAAESAVAALRTALHVLFDDPVFPPDQLPAIASLALQTPSIRARQLEKLERWEQLLAPEIVRRMTAEQHDDEDAATLTLRARALTGAMLVCLRLVTEEWLKQAGDFDARHALDQLLTSTAQ